MAVHFQTPVIFSWFYVAVGYWLVSCLSKRVFPGEVQKRRRAQKKSHGYVAFASVSRDMVELRFQHLKGYEQESELLLEIWLGSGALARCRRSANAIMDAALYYSSMALSLPEFPKNPQLFSPSTTGRMIMKDARFALVTQFTPILLYRLNIGSTLSVPAELTVWGFITLWQEGVVVLRNAKMQHFLWIIHCVLAKLPSSRSFKRFSESSSFTRDPDTLRISGTSVISSLLTLVMCLFPEVTIPSGLS